MDVYYNLTAVCTLRACQILIPTAVHQQRMGKGYGMSQVINLSIGSFPIKIHENYLASDTLID